MTTASLVSQILIWGGLFAIAAAIRILFRGEFSTRAGVTTQTQDPIAFLLTVAVIFIAGVGAILIGLGKI